jgi:hypothetical protein
MMALGANSLPNVRETAMIVRKARCMTVFPPYTLFIGL